MLEYSIYRQLFDTVYRKQLVAHIIREVEAGVDALRVKESLLKEGWPKKDINDAFYYSLHPAGLKHFSLIRFLDSEVHVYIAILLLLGSLAGFSIVFAEFKAEERNYKVYIVGGLESPRQLLEYGARPALANPAFFEKVKKEFISQKSDFVEVDLSAMRVAVYKKGAVATSTPVITKGRPGSWWETPAGLYKISTKEKSHYSNIGGVFMPYSMNFQGNFYIHGWPKYKSGKPVSSTYSGGCIRLTDESAKAIFELVEIGTPILVFEKDYSADEFSYLEKKPELSAKHLLAADLGNNYVFLKEDDGPVPVASITKLITALVTTEYISLDKEVAVPKEAIVFTSRPRLKEGQKISVYQLLFPLLLESSNEAAEAISRSVGRAYFVRLMNEKAKAIGMLQSKFEDPSGAGAGNVSTVDDLFMLAKYIHNNRRFVFDITSDRIKNSAYGDSKFTDLKNLNDFGDREEFIGGKVGKTTAANETGLYLFDLKFGEKIRPIVVIVLDSKDRKKDASEIISFIQGNYTALIPAQKELAD